MQKSVKIFDDGNLTPIAPNTHRTADGTICYRLLTKRYSHWVLDENGEMEYITESRIKVRDGWYGIAKEFTNKDTAFIVMDPWIDWPDDFLTDYFGAITKNYTLPLIQAAVNAGHPVFILTDDAEKSKFNAKITPGLQELADAGKTKVLYHTDYTAESFLKLIGDMGIEKLIYTGYCTNICVMFRELGVAQMSKKIQTFFLPKCAGAMEHGDTWDTGEVHKFATFILGQTRALLIEFDDIIKALGELPKEVT